MPAQVYAPFPLQRTANAAPAGPAALLVGPFGGGEFGAYESRNLLVGRDGSYRLLRTVNNTDVIGKDVLLSPDGRYVAGNGGLEGSHSADWGTAVLDLTNGRVRDYAGGVPVAWMPDGRRLLVAAVTPAERSGGDGWVRLLDLDTGETRNLFGFADVEVGGLVAPSPDGSRIAAQLGTGLQVFDLAASQGRKIADIGANRRLAGPGAWTPNGRIALVELTGCARNCAYPDASARTFRIVYVDAATGRAVDGPTFHPVRGIDARVVGWRGNGDAMATVFQPVEPTYPDKPMPTVGGVWPNDGGWGAENVELVALHPGGGRTELVRLPDYASEVDVALDLLSADRFGGPVPSIRARLADWLVPWTRRLALIAAVVAAVIAVRRWRSARAYGRYLKSAR
ncbi:MAG TPA: WD40 repeat domain-containing protein [Micromonosporaceae bacterium]